MSTARNKEVVRRFLEEHTRRIPDELFAPGYANYGAGPDRPMDLESVKRDAAGFYDIFPDIEVTIEDLLAEGDRVAAGVVITATQRGTFEGIPATGKRITVTGTEFFRLENGKIVQDRPLVDMQELVRKLTTREYLGTATNHRCSRCKQNYYKRLAEAPCSHARQLPSMQLVCAPIHRTSPYYVARALCGRACRCRQDVVVAGPLACRIPPHYVVPHPKTVGRCACRECATSFRRDVSAPTEGTRYVGARDV